MFDLDRYLRERRARVDAALNCLMPPATERPAVLHKAMRYSVFSGGKRLRPILSLAAAEAAGAADADVALPAAAAVELLHTYTLIHDDLPCMDNDDFRRGKPTCHRAFGEANAVLAADALQALAFEVLAGAPPPPPHPSGLLVRELAVAAGSRGVIGGQVEDLAAVGVPVTRETVDSVHLRKTAVLFRAAARMGAAAAGAVPATLDALGDYGLNLGLAFQIVDDLLDAAPEGHATAPATELSCLSVYDVPTARRRAGELTQDAIARLAALGTGRTQALVALAEALRQRSV